MPRGIGARSGVKLTVTGASAARPSACSISGVCWCAPPILYALSWPITVLASSASLALRPAPVVPLAATTTTSSGSTRPAASSGASPRIDPGRVAARAGDPGRAGELLAGVAELGQPVRPGAGVLAAVVAASTAAGSTSRWSAPRSTTSTSDGSCAAIAADSPCGSARNTTSAPCSASASVGTKVRSASATQVRVQVGHRAAGAAARGQRPHLQVGVAEQQADELAAGVPGRADDRCDALLVCHDASTIYAYPHTPAAGGVPLPAETSAGVLEPGPRPDAGQQPLVRSVVRARVEEQPRRHVDRAAGGIGSDPAARRVAPASGGRACA